jgi:hypothetical protein
VPASTPTAVLSDDRRYRYALWRDTGALGGEGTVLFVGLNPSTADETENDPTIRRCIGFARDWGFARLAMANVFAFRATDPRALYPSDRAIDPVGPENDRWLRELAADSQRVIAAWGASAHVTAKREAEVLCALAYTEHQAIECLALTKALRPQHPLYVPADKQPESYALRAAA